MTDSADDCWCPCNSKSSPRNAHNHHHYDYHNQDYPASLVEKALENHGAQLSQQLFKQLFQPQCQVKETRKSNSNTTTKNIRDGVALPYKLLLLLYTLFTQWHICPHTLLYGQSTCNWWGFRNFLELERDGMVWYGMGRDGLGRDRTGRDGTYTSSD